MTWSLSAFGAGKTFRKSSCFRSQHVFSFIYDVLSDKQEDAARFRLEWQVERMCVSNSVHETGDKVRPPVVLKEISVKTQMVKCYKSFLMFILGSFAVALSIYSDKQK